MHNHPSYHRCRYCCPQPARKRKRKKKKKPCRLSYGHDKRCGTSKSSNMRWLKTLRRPSTLDTLRNAGPQLPQLRSRYHYLQRRYSCHYSLTALTRPRLAGHVRGGPEAALLSHAAPETPTRYPYCYITPDLLITAACTAALLTHGCSGLAVTPCRHPAGHCFLYSTSQLQHSTSSIKNRQPLLLPCLNQDPSKRFHHVSTTAQNVLA